MAMSGKMVGLAHIGIRVRDADASLDFYVNKLGFEKKAEFMLGQARLVFVDLGSCQVELIQTPDHDERIPGQIDHVAIEVENIDAVMDDLKAKGIEFDTPTANFAETLFGGARNVFFKGLDGERIELFDYLKK